MGVLSLSFVIMLAEAAAHVPAPEAPAALTTPPPDRSMKIEPVMLDDIAVTADEPRFVAPTRRDRIGRIWAPVEINGKGPFRLVLDTGASSSALTAGVAEELGIVLDPAHKVMLRGATGSVAVPLVPVESLEVGDLLMEPNHLPIIPDALGGAEGMLGTDGLANKRIHIDFRSDSITIMRSRNERATSGFATIPVKFLRGRLLIVDAYLGGVRGQGRDRHRWPGDARERGAAHRARRASAQVQRRDPGRSDRGDARRADGQSRRRRRRSRWGRSWCGMPR